MLLAWERGQAGCFQTFFSSCLHCWLITQCRNCCPLPLASKNVGYRNLNFKAINLRLCSFHCLVCLLLLRSLVVSQASCSLDGYQQEILLGSVCCSSFCCVLFVSSVNAHIWKCIGSMQSSSGLGSSEHPYVHSRSPGACSDPCEVLHPGCGSVVKLSHVSSFPRNQAIDSSQRQAGSVQFFSVHRLLAEAMLQPCGIF